MAPFPGINPSRHGSPREGWWHTQLIFIPLCTLQLFALFGLLDAGITGDNWDTDDLHVSPVPFHTSPRLELEAAGRICQPTGHSTNQMELACPYHPFQLLRKD